MRLSASDWRALEVGLQRVVAAGAVAGFCWGLTVALAGLALWAWQRGGGLLVPALMTLVTSFAALVAGEWYALEERRCANLRSRMRARMRTWG